MENEERTDDLTPPEETPPGAERPEPEPLSFDTDDLFSQGSAAIVMPGSDAEADDGDAVEDEPVGTDEPEPEPEETPDDEGDQPEGEQEAEGAAAEQMRQWVLMLHQNPNRFNEIPQKSRADAIRTYAASAYERGRQDTLAAAQQQSSQEERLRSFVQQKDAERADDPDAFMEWADAHPEQAETFWAGKRYFAQKAGQQQEQDQPTQATQEQATQELSRIAALPTALRQRIAERVQAGEFLLTSDGLGRLKQAIDQSFVEAMTQPTPAPEPPERGAAQRRQQAAQERSTAARPVSGPSVGSDSTSVSYDPDELFSMAAGRR